MGPSTTSSLRHLFCNISKKPAYIYDNPYITVLHLRAFFHTPSSAHIPRRRSSDLDTRSHNPPTYNPPAYNPQPQSSNSQSDLHNQPKPSYRASPPIVQPSQDIGEAPPQTFTVEEACVLPTETRWDGLQLRRRLRHLLEVDHGPFRWRWSLTPDKRSLTKTFLFKTEYSARKFKRYAYAFASTTRYKLDISDTKLKVIVHTLSSGGPGEVIGISKRDVHLAEVCDRIAETVKEEEETPEEKSIRIENSYAKIREHIGNREDTDEEYVKTNGVKNYEIKRLLITPNQEDTISDDTHMSRDSSDGKTGNMPETKGAEQNHSTRPKEKEGIVDIYDSLIANVEKEKAEGLRRNEPRYRRGSTEKPDVKIRQDRSPRLEDEGGESRDSMSFPTLDMASSEGDVEIGRTSRYPISFQTSDLASDVKEERRRERGMWRALIRTEQSKERIEQSKKRTEQSKERTEQSKERSPKRGKVKKTWQERVARKQARKIAEKGDTKASFLIARSEEEKEERSVLGQEVPKVPGLNVTKLQENLTKWQEREARKKEQKAAKAVKMAAKRKVAKQKAANREATQRGGEKGLKSGKSLQS